MAEVAEDLAPRLRATAATLDVEAALPEVDGDPRQLRRLLQNLVADAVKFRGAQAPRIEVSAVDGADGCIVTLRDNGIGVDPGHAGRIFGMFARGRGDTEGTGIDLAICRRVVEAHGGHIQVEPAEGGGSALLLHAAMLSAVIEPERWGEDPKLERAARRAGREGVPRPARELPGGRRRAVGDPRRGRSDRRLRLRLRQPLDHAQLPPRREHARPLHPAGRPAADARQRCLRRLRPGVRRRRAWVQEITYDTPFGDGYMLGTFIQRTAKLGDGLVVFLTDVTDQRRMEAELRSFADVVAHDLREPVSGHHPPRHAAGAPRRRTAVRRRPASAARERERARELIDGVLAYARAGEMRQERVTLEPGHGRGRAGPARAAGRDRCHPAGRPAARGRRRRAPVAPSPAEPGRQRGEVPRASRRRASRSPRRPTASSGS